MSYKSVFSSYKLVDVRFDMTYLMQARIEEFVHKVKLVMLILLSRQLKIAEYSRDSVGWAPTSICLD